MYDSAKRTTVIDDQMDYYSVNSGWLSSKQRDDLQKKAEERQEKKHGSRRTKKITIDFAGIKIFFSQNCDYEHAIPLVFKELCIAIFVKCFTSVNIRYFKFIWISFFKNSIKLVL